MTSEIIQKKLAQLPEQARREALDYIEYLLQKYGTQAGKRGFRFDWEGGLEEYKDRFTSVELQHKATEWR
ncbi:MAG: DUF2281 domain-containing protein [Candidatus Zixiibacteriota bacterium]|nr:MAG: DUF2281 domain-containing protein [candidate division Zixibacteria bacterium]